MKKTLRETNKERDTKRLENYLVSRFVDYSEDIACVSETVWRYVNKNNLTVGDKVVCDLILKNYKIFGGKK